RWTLVAVLALTGWAPALGFHLLPLSGGAAFLATLVLVRYAARPSRRAEPDRWPWKVIAGAVGIAAVVAGTYASFHPLGTEGSGNGYFSQVDEDGVAIQLHNNAFVDLTVLSMDAPAKAAGGMPGFSSYPLRGTRIGARKSLWIVLPASAC